MILPWFKSDPKAPSFFVKPGEPSKTKQKSNSICLPDWSEIRQNFRQVKYFDSLNGQLTMPVRYGRNNHNPQYESLSHQHIKELKQAIKDSGLTSPYFDNVAKSIFNSYDLTPTYCHIMASMTSSNSQYILWDLEWRKLNRLIENYLVVSLLSLILLNYSEIHLLTNLKMKHITVQGCSRRY